MSVTINRSGGGGGSIQSTDALVRVVTDYGSSVSVTAGGTTKNLKPLVIIGDTDHSCYYDLVKPGAFSSTARSYSVTLGGNTVSDTLVVNAAGEYTKPISFWNGEFYLDGNQYPEITGGWSARNTRYSTYDEGTIHAVTPDFDTSGSTMVASVNTKTYTDVSGSVQTNNAIDLTEYSTITFTVTHTYSDYRRRVFYFVTATDTAPGDVFSPAVQTVSTTAGEQTITLDVSGLTGSYYVGFNLIANGAGSTTVTVSSIIAS